MTQNCNCHGSGGQYSQTVAGILERPRYSPGLILEDSDLSSAVDYTQSLSRLLFRNLFGCGVICGLTVKVDMDCGLHVTVSPGLALDGCGDPLQLPAPVTIAFDKRKADEIGKAGSSFWVTLCGKEKLCQPRALVCEADDYDGVTQATRIRSLSEVSISFEKPECVCECLPAKAKTEAAQRDPATGAVTGGRVPATGDPCHAEHEARVDCAEDCGCGTACDCGCCVLLARASFVNGKWSVQHKGVRRLVRAALVMDRGVPGDAEPARAPQAMEGPPAPPKTGIAAAPQARVDTKLAPAADEEEDDVPPSSDKPK